MDEEEMAAALRALGYLVVKIPECKQAGRGHGSHVLITRSAKCPGEQPMPHGFVNGHFGLFGYWCYCACGGEFRDYESGDEEMSPWAAHKAEHGIA